MLTIIVYKIKTAFGKFIGIEFHKFLSTFKFKKKKSLS